MDTKDIILAILLFVIVVIVIRSRMSVSRYDSNIMYKQKDTDGCPAGWHPQGTMMCRKDGS